MSESSHTPLPAKNALPSEAGSLALAIDGTACCWATSGPAIVCVRSQLLSGVKPPRVWSRVSERQRPPTEYFSASCIWSGFLYCCFPLFIHITVFKLAIHTLLALSSLRGRSKDDSHSEKPIQFQSRGHSSRCPEYWGTLSLNISICSLQLCPCPLLGLPSGWSMGFVTDVSQGD